MIECAYVEPNEPQMIDIMFIKSKHSLTFEKKSDWFHWGNLRWPLQLAWHILYLAEHHFGYWLTTHVEPTEEENEKCSALGKEKEKKIQ